MAILISLKLVGRVTSGLVDKISPEQQYLYPKREKKLSKFYRGK